MLDKVKEIFKKVNSGISLSNELTDLFDEKNFLNQIESQFIEYLEKRDYKAIEMYIFKKLVELRKDIWLDIRNLFEKDDELRALKIDLEKKNSFNIEILRKENLWNDKVKKLVNLWYKVYNLENEFGKKLLDIWRKGRSIEYVDKYSIRKIKVSDWPDFAVNRWYILNPFDVLDLNWCSLWEVYSAGVRFNFKKISNLNWNNWLVEVSWGNSLNLLSKYEIFVGKNLENKSEDFEGVVLVPAYVWELEDTLVQLVNQLAKQENREKFIFVFFINWSKEKGFEDKDITYKVGFLKALLMSCWLVDNVLIISWFYDRKPTIWKVRKSLYDISLAILHSIWVDKNLFLFSLDADIKYLSKDYLKKLKEYLIKNKKLWAVWGVRRFSEEKNKEISKFFEMPEDESYFREEKILSYIAERIFSMVTYRLNGRWLATPGHSFVFDIKTYLAVFWFNSETFLLEDIDLWDKIWSLWSMLWLKAPIWVVNSARVVISEDRLQWAIKRWGVVSDQRKPKDWLQGVTREEFKLDSDDNILKLKIIIRKMLKREELSSEEIEIFSNWLKYQYRWSLTEQRKKWDKESFSEQFWDMDFERYLYVKRNLRKRFKWWWNNNLAWFLWYEVEFEGDDIKLIKV